ncbi:MAG: histidine--tRNA ligase [Firmicutes bacterium]|nr:histidine--tRNA ligase [Bacillota bacterium]
MEFRAPRGTRDILPSEIGRWQHLESCFQELCRLHGFEEIRTPLFEHTELFSRSVGEESDIVSKEMYTFLDRGGRQVTLRPEGTAPVVRAYLQRGLASQPQPVKLYYYGPMFRYDRPQAGRYRQFHQVGVEMYGAGTPAADLEVISLCTSFFNRLGVNGAELQLNSVGCSRCRPPYRERLVSFLKPREELLCADCRRRHRENPLRVLDCKRPGCRRAITGAPLLAEYLCRECSEHFLALLRLLDRSNIPYRENPYLVRGLDYYTRTAFEFVPREGNDSGSLGGGGRYDDLVEYCGGPATPAVGVALGVERILLAMGEPEGDRYSPGVYIACAPGEEEAEVEALSLARELRDLGVVAEPELTGRSLRGQLKLANRKGYRRVIIIGPRELEQGLFTLRDMVGGSQREYSRSDLLAEVTRPVSGPNSE